MVLSVYPRKEKFTKPSVVPAGTLSKNSPSELVTVEILVFLSETVAKTSGFPVRESTTSPLISLTPGETVCADTGEAMNRTNKQRDR